MSDVRTINAFDEYNRLLAEKERLAQRLLDVSEWMDKTSARLQNIHLLLAREISDEAAVIRGALRRAASHDS